MTCFRGKASPDQHTRLRLFAEAAGFCQRPECPQRRLFIDTNSGNIHIGEMAHVFAASNRGPRANRKLSKEERGSFENLILLCPSCHRIIDKAPNDFPDERILEWKRCHSERLGATFGAIEYRSRDDARSAIARPLAENRAIFDEYGPNNNYRFDPESELAHLWQRKVRSKILPNNRKILAILDANLRHLRGQETATLEQFRHHVDDLEARHLGEGNVAAGCQFPEEIRQILAAGDA